MTRSEFMAVATHEIARRPQERWRGTGVYYPDHRRDEPDVGCILVLNSPRNYCYTHIMFSARMISRMDGPAAADMVRRELVCLRRQLSRFICEHRDECKHHRWLHGGRLR